MGANINSQLPFSEIVKVRYSDLDAQGHLYFAKYLIFGDEVLGAYMEQLGLSIMDPLSAPSLIFTVNIHCEYHNEIAGNSEIAVYVGYGRLGNSSADAVFELYNNASGTLLASGGLTQVFVDPKTRQSMPIPEFYRANVIAQQQSLETS